MYLLGSRQLTSIIQTIILVAVSGAAVICGLGANLYNRECHRNLLLYPSC